MKNEQDEIINKLRRIEQRYKKRWDDAVRQIEVARDTAAKAQKDWMDANKTLTEALVRKEAGATRK